MTPDWRTVWQAEDFDLRVEKASVNNRNLHRIMAGGGRAGAVVIAVAEDLVLLIRHSRPIVGQTLWELPRGFGDAADSDPADTAIRELLEETGVRGGEPQILGEIWPDSGLLANPVNVVLVPIEKKDVAFTLDPTDDEAEERVWRSLDEIRDLAKKGELCDGISLAALALWGINCGRSQIGS